MFTLLCCFFCAHIICMAAEKPRDIYVIYDTSGSMLEPGKYSNYPWYEAGYATEIFYSLLEKGDQLYIYFMSDEGDYYYRKVYSGKSGAAQILHADLSSIEYTDNTYIDGLIEAVREITKPDESREKYLVVLSDGDFNRNGEIRIKEKEKLLVDELKKVYGISIPTGYLKLSDGVKFHDEHIKIFDIKGLDSSRTGKDGKILDVFSDMGNWVFGRQELSYQEMGDTGDGSGKRRISFTTELPVRRLMLVGQGSRADEKVDSGAIVFDSAAFKSGDGAQGRSVIEGLSKENVTYYGPNYERIMKNLLDGNYSGIVCTWNGAKTNGLAAPGTYIMEIPSNMYTDIYVEYDIEYRVILEGISDGKQEMYSLQDNAPCLSGNYKLKVELIDSLSGEPIPENAAIYDLLKVDLTVHNNSAQKGASEGGSIEENVAERVQEISLREGELNVSGELTLGENIPVSVAYDKRVAHRLGTVALSVHGLDADFDIDALNHMETAIVLEVRENGSDISRDIEVLATGVRGYQYECRHSDGSWMICPVLKEGARPFVGEDQVTLQVKGRIDGQAVAESKKITVNYKVEPKTIGYEWELSGRFPFDSTVLIHPYIMGKQLAEANDLARPDVELSNYEEVQSVTGRFMSLENGENSFQELEKKDEVPVTFCLDLNGFRAWRLFVFGGTLEGKMKGSCIRQRVSCTGEQIMYLSIPPVPPAVLWFFGVILGIFIWTGFGKLVKCCRCSRFGSVKAERSARFLQDESPNTVELKVKKCTLRNFFIFWNSKRVIKTDDVPGGRIILVSVSGKKLRIANAEELKTSVWHEYEGDLDKVLRWNGALILKVKGDYPLEIHLKRSEG